MHRFRNRLLSAVEIFISPKKIQTAPLCYFYFVFIPRDGVLAKKIGLAKQKFRPTRPGGFSGAKAYIRYVEVLKKRRNAVGRTFCDASGSRSVRGREPLVL